MKHPDPGALARWQIKHDRARCEAAPGLLAHKITLMRASSFAFLRGSAPMFYKLLADTPELRNFPRGSGWIVGDLHLENFGAWRVSSTPKRSARSVVYDVNDFDEAVRAPWGYDLLRVVTSIVLGVTASDKQRGSTKKLGEVFLRAWREQVFRQKALPAAPPPVSRLMADVNKRTRAELLAERTEVVDGARRFTRDGARYADIDARERGAVEAAFQRYVDKVALPKPVKRAAFAVTDVAFRVAGTGSLGLRRFAILTRGEGEADEPWMFDMKEQGLAAATLVADIREARRAKRVLAATTACLTAPPRLMETVRMGERSMLVRRLRPQEDKLKLQKHLRSGEIPELVGYLGALSGRVHRRGAEALPKAWNDGQLAGLIERASVVAELHHTAWRAFCDETARDNPSATT